MTEVTLAVWDATPLWWIAMAFFVPIVVGIVLLCITGEDLWANGGIGVGVMAAFITLLFIYLTTGGFNTDQRVNALIEKGYTLVEVDGNSFFAADPDGQAVRGTFANIQGDKWLIVEFK